MLSFDQKLAFLTSALLAIAAGIYTWTGLLRRIMRGRRDTDLRFNRPLRRFWYTIQTTVTQSRTFRKRPVVSFFHSLIFYGFVFYLLVNLVDAAEGFIPFHIRSTSLPGLTYNFLADVLSALVLVGVLALVLRRFVLPSRRDFSFNERTLLHIALKSGSIQTDSIIVSTFILFHVGSRAIGAGAKISEDAPDSFQPFATLLSHAISPQYAHVGQVWAYWGALGSILAFLAYFPRSKHIHIFLAPVKYGVAREPSSGVLPNLVLDLESENPSLGASRLEDLAWPRLLDAYACIQCNRCQDVCPATTTGKSLSPSALEINKRMELNELGREFPGFAKGEPSPRPLLDFALSVEAVWGCTTCGACLDVCPVQDEPMLDIIDIRRQQVMIEGAFPVQLQTAFRGMERSNNPWGINHERRMDWSEGLNVPTTESNPDPDVLFWVGCAASYDPQSQKTARAFVQLLDHAGVDFAVLGKRECCTGDTARRAGNEFLYRQLADQNVSTLNEVNPKLIVATCPHCMNSVGKEYAQIGGNYQVMHHTEYLQSLVDDGRLVVDAGDATVAFHDPCYLGRHNGVYDAPRNLLNILSNSVVELDRNRENSFCCGAGGAQFWKEEEPGDQRVSDNRFQEVERKLAGTTGATLAVGCPFCKSMLESTPGKGDQAIAVRDIAELMLDGVRRRLGEPVAAPQIVMERSSEAPKVSSLIVQLQEPVSVQKEPSPETSPQALKKWVPKQISTPSPKEPPQVSATSSTVERKKWSPKSSSSVSEDVTPVAESETTTQTPTGEPPKRKVWNPKSPPGE